MLTASLDGARNKTHEVARERVSDVGVVTCDEIIRDWSRITM